MIALETGWSHDADFLEVEIQNESSGQPVVVLYGKTKSHFEKSTMTKIFVSLSHGTGNHHNVIRLGKQELNDFGTVDEIGVMQNLAFKKHMDHISKNSKYYQNLFDSLGIAFDDIKSLDDITKIPTTQKTEVEKYNRDFWSVPQNKIIEFVTISGTLGNPITVVLSKTDQARLAYNESRSLAMCGIDENDTDQTTTTLDKRFMAGMAYYLGATAIGAAVARSGVGDPSFQWDDIQRFEPTVLVAVPSFAYKLGAFLLSQGIDPKTTSVKKIVCIGEPIRSSDFSPNTLNQKLTELWGTELFSTYASTEMSTTLTGCSHGQGGHLLPELVYLEVLDKNERPVKSGEVGELVVTPFGIEGIPLLRYKTGDLAKCYSGPCTCGRLTTPRIGPIEGRKDQMIKLKGTCFLNSFKGLDNYIMELTSDTLDLDKLDIVFYKEIDSELLTKVKNELRQKLRVNPNVIQKELNYIKSQILPRGSRKPRRFVDKRVK